MKVGRTVNLLAAEIDRQRQSKRDYLAPTRELQAVAGQGGQIGLTMGTEGSWRGMGVSDLGHDQLSEWAKIPKGYYDRMPAGGP